jgi:Ala-tRNA(Pro) deacylase
MTMARRLKWYLDAREVEYEVLPHDPSSTSEETARKAAIPPQRLAKPVLLEDDRGYVMAVVPASHRSDLVLASERELTELFHDCEPGAIPALGPPYRVPTVYDDALCELEDVYFEAGDHEDLVHMDAASFLHLLRDSLHGRFSRAL